MKEKIEEIINKLINYDLTRTDAVKQLQNLAKTHHSIPSMDIYDTSGNYLTSVHSHSLSKAKEIIENSHYAHIDIDWDNCKIPLLP
jgi:hypothetical protein